MLEQSLASLEEALPGFVRAHRGELVRVAGVTRMAHDGEGPFVELGGGLTVRVSRRHLADVKHRLGLG